jgi:hypothetical protein
MIQGVGGRKEDAFIAMYFRYTKSGVMLFQGSLGLAVDVLQILEQPLEKVKQAV